MRLGKADIEQREKAWAIRSYPCTGLGLWLSPMISRSPAYSTIIERLQSGQVLMDIGCYLGHDLRRLVADGAPASQLYAVDIVSHWDVGYELFQDRDRFSTHFIESDMLYPNAELAQLQGKIDIITIIHVLHQWTWGEQITAVKKLIGILAPKPGSMVVGFQIGSTLGSDLVALNQKVSKPTFWHNPESFARLWKQAGEETGTQWKSEAELLTFDQVLWETKDVAYLGEEARIISFVVTRV